MNFIAQGCDDKVVYLVSDLNEDAALKALVLLLRTERNLEKAPADFDITEVGLNSWPPDGEAIRLT